MEGSLTTKHFSDLNQCPADFVNYTDSRTILQSHARACSFIKQVRDILQVAHVLGLPDSFGAREVRRHRAQACARADRQGLQGALRARAPREGELL